MYARLLFNILYFLLSIIIGIWLFSEGYINIKTGMVTNFGVDSLFYRFEKWMKIKNDNWKNPIRARISGVIAIIIAVEFLIVALVIFNQSILPFLINR